MGPLDYEVTRPLTRYMSMLDEHQLRNYLQELTLSLSDFTDSHQRIEVLLQITTVKYILGLGPKHILVPRPVGVSTQIEMNPNSYGGTVTVELAPAEPFTPSEIDPSPPISSEWPDGTMPNQGSD